MLCCKKLLFSAYYQNKSIVVVSPDKQKMEHFHNTIKQHKYLYNKWLNNAINLSKGENDRELFDLTETNTSIDIDKYKFVPAYLDINDDTDVRFIHQLYDLANIELFMMYEFEYIEDIPLLSIQGVRIQKPDIENIFKEHDFLDAIFELDID